MLAREDAEGLHALQTMTEQFQPCEWSTVILENCIINLEIMSGLWDAPDYPTCPHTPLQ
jgi:hypothetical protein